MGIETVRRFFEERNLDVPIIEHEKITATVALAAEAFGVEPGRIAKTLSFRLADGKVVIVVARGDARIDNRKFKDFFGKRGTMLGGDEVEDVTGHPVGGVCPFGLKEDFQIYLDVSLKDFDEVLPAAGSINSAVRLTPDFLQEIVNGKWVDVCQRSEAVKAA